MLERDIILPLKSPYHPPTSEKGSSADDRSGSRATALAALFCYSPGRPPSVSQYGLARQSDNKPVSLRREEPQEEENTKQNKTSIEEEEERKERKVINSAPISAPFSGGGHAQHALDSGRKEQPLYTTVRTKVAKICQ